MEHFGIKIPKTLGNRIRKIVRTENSDRITRKVSKTDIGIEALSAWCDQYEEQQKGKDGAPN